MKANKLYFSLLGIALMGVACAPPAPEEPIAAPEPAAPSAEELLDELVVAWDAGLNGLDADAILALYTDVGGTMMAPDQPALMGKEAIRGWVENLFAQGAVQVSNKAEKHYVTGDWAFSRGRYTLSVTPEEGESTTAAGKWVAVWQRQADGSWKLARNIWNPNSPPAGVEPPPAAGAGEAAEFAMPESPPCVESLDGADQAFVDNFAPGDAAAVAALHTETGRRMPPYMPAVVGRPAIANYVQVFVDLFEPRELTVTQEANQSSGNWGVAWGQYQFDYTPKAGGETASGAGKYLTVAQLGDDGCWRYEWVIWNSDTPPASPEG